MYAPYSDYINVTTVSFAAPKLCIAQIGRETQQARVCWMKCFNFLLSFDSYLFNISRLQIVKSADHGSKQQYSCSKKGRGNGPALENKNRL